MKTNTTIAHSPSRTKTTHGQLGLVYRPRITSHDRLYTGQKGTRPCIENIPENQMITRHPSSFLTNQRAQIFLSVFQDELDCVVGYVMHDGYMSNTAVTIKISTGEERGKQGLSWADVTLTGLLRTNHKIAT